MKRGRMSADDKKKMVDLHLAGKTNAHIAKKLGRSEDFIAKSLGVSVVAPVTPVAPVVSVLPEPLTVKEVMLPKDRKKGVVVMTEAASQLGDETRKSGLGRFTDCITKVDPSR